jgi:AcrR family transcriptional regulator
VTDQLMLPTRDRLLRAAQQLIEEGGYGAASVAAIADRAGVAAGTLYRHFASKEELFVEVFRSVCEREEHAIWAAAAEMDEAASAADRLQAVFATFARRALRNPRLAWALIAEPVDPLVDAERLAYRHEYAHRLVAALEQGIADREIPDQDVDITAAALVGALGEALVGPLAPAAGKRPSADALIEALRLFVRRAVGG